MALQLNLLHEQITAERRRQRDPLKIGMMLLAVVGTLMVVFYMWKAYQTLAIKNRLSTVQKEWAKVEPSVTAAQKRSAELNEIIKTTRVLDRMIEERFYWAPLLQTLSRCVAPNAQLTAIDGSVSEDRRTVAMTLDGIAAGREPRADAEELRQLLIDQLGRSYGEVKVEFKSLEDLDTIVSVAGANMPMARYSISATFNTTAAEAATPAPSRAPKK
jgi:hypothetical protein